MKIKHFLLLALTVGIFAASAFSQDSPQVLLNGSVAIPARNHWRVAFVTNSRGGEVKGRFRAEGGGNNDIYCYIVDSDGYENLKNGNQFFTYYNSGKVTVANVNVRLPANGVYYLVLSNAHSAFSPKTVYGNIEYRNR